MMELEKPWEFKEVDNNTTTLVEEEEQEEEEEDAGALHTRNRKNKPEEEEEEQKQKQKQKQSVFLDSTNVSDNATESSTEQEFTKMGQSDLQKEEDNECGEAKELEKQENFNAQEKNKNATNDKLETGLDSNGVQEASSSNETTADGEAGPKLIATIGESANSLANRSTGALDVSSSITNPRSQVHEIEAEKVENVKKGRVNIEEYDLEKILDEQETHDLYCPNCKSCITRRVILRKRKRTVRQALRDEPPKKPQIAERSADTSHQNASEQHDQDAPEVFRCLSCLTFFIPTGCGFNILRIFERRDMNQRVQVQHPSASPESNNCGTWLLSCFQTVDSPQTSTDAGPEKEPLLSGSQGTSGQISLVEDNTESVHIHATTEEIAQSKKPSLSGSSSMVQTSAEEKEKIKQFHGTASSSVTVRTSSSTTSTISFSQSKTGFIQTEAKWNVSGQQDIGHQEQIPLSEPASDVLTNPIHLDHIPQNTTAASSDGKPFFNQYFFRSELKFPDAIPKKVLPEVKDLLSQKPTPAIPPPVQSGSEPHLILPIIHDDVTSTPVPAPSQRDEWDILKAIVYGGLGESMTSLSVVSAAAASSAKTLDIFILGMANLIGGLPIIFHNIVDLRNLGDGNENVEQVGQYWLQLGRRSKYRLHMVIAVLSYILFGLLPPVMYGLSFRKSDNRENKMMVVAAASLACVALLAIGKAHVKRPRAYEYFRTVLYYLSIGLSGSGLSYVAGVLITRLLAHFGLIDQGAAPAPPLPGLFLPDADATGAWASY